MKYSEEPYKLTKAYAKAISDKVDLFQLKIKTKKQIFITLISPFGLAQGLWNDEVVHQVVNLDQMW